MQEQGLIPHEDRHLPCSEGGGPDVLRVHSSTAAGKSVELRQFAPGEGLGLGSNFSLSNCSSHLWPEEGVACVVLAGYRCYRSAPGISGSDPQPQYKYSVLTTV